MTVLKSSFNFLRILLLPILFLIALNSWSQNLEKTLTIKFKNKPLGEIIHEISEAGQINFSYSSSLIPIDKKITIKAKNKSIREILNDIFLKNDIEYIILENQVILKNKLTEKSQNTSSNIADNEKQKHKYTISGYLKDQSNGEILIGASVCAKGTSMGTFSNAYGFFSLTLPEDKYDIVISSIGYKKIIQEINVKANIKLSFELEISNSEISEVEIIDDSKGSSIKNNQSSEMKLTPKILTQMPGFVGDVDVIKSLQSIPGIKTYGDGSAMFYVRGGNSDQNLLLIDDAPIYNPSHLFGFFSALAPNAIKDVQVYKGDFPSNFGDRLSSVIDIKSKDGNLKHFEFSGNLGPFTSNLSIEGPIIKDRSSFFISGRISNMDWMNYFNIYDKPIDVMFFDINAKLNFKVNDNNRLYLTFYGGSDDLGNITNSSISTFGIGWHNIVGSFRWNHIFNDRIFSNTTLYSSQYKYFLYVSREHNDYWNTSISNFAFKDDFTFYVNPKNTLKTGVELSSHLSNPGNIYFSDPEVQKNAPQIPMYNSLEYIFYICNEQEITKKLSIRYGVRLPVWQDFGATTVYGFNSQYKVIDTLEVGKNALYKTYYSPEPRINLQYAFSNKISLKASYSRTTQFMQLLSNSTSPFTSLEVFVPCGPNIKPQKADQFALGYFQQIQSSKFIFSAETFYKKFYNQNDYADHANMLYNPLIEGELRFGSAWSYGAELMIRKPEGIFTGWIGYTYSRTFKQIDGINHNNAFPAFYDRPHNICVNLAYTISKRLACSATWVYLTGAAITTPTGFYYYNGYTIPLYEEKNNDRLPAYHRLDLAMTLKLNKPEKRYQHNITLTLYNAYGRDNPISVNFNKIINSNGKFVVPSNLSGDYELFPSFVTVAGIIPSITYNFKF